VSGVWQSPAVRSLRRPLVLGTVLAAAVLGVAGCRTSPSVAAYVGDSTVTVDELTDAVDARLADPAISQSAAGREEQLTRGVLSLLVDQEVYAEAARRYDVQVSDGEVQQRIDTLLTGQDPDAAFAQAAAQGLTRADVTERIREQLVRERVAQAAGQAQGLTDAALQAQYQQSLPSLTQTTLGIITVPDQATADDVLAQLTDDTTAYPALATQYAGPNTLPTPQAFTGDQLSGLPQELAPGLASTQPGNGFTVDVPQAGGVVVVFVGAKTAPTFEEARPQLEQQASGAADDAGQTIVDQVRGELGIKVNPRYGQLQDGKVVPFDSGQVDILQDSGAPATASGAAAQPTG
jgi:peptidyl-prolyl cis-trans isomerase SurA